MKKLLCLLSLISGFSYGLQPINVDLKTETVNICDKLTDNDDQNFCVTMGNNVHILKYIERQNDIYHVWSSLVNITIKNPMFLMQLATLEINHFEYHAWNQHNLFYVVMQYNKNVKQHTIAIVNTNPKSYYVAFHIDDYKNNINSKAGFADIYLYEKTFVENNRSNDLGVVYFNEDNAPTRVEVKGEKCNTNEFKR